MLARTFRLVKESDFTKVLRKGRGWRTPQAQFKSLSNGLKISRFGIVVSNKVSKKASKRNLLKRRLREIIRGLMPDIKPGYDIVLIAYPPLLEKDFSQLQELVSQAFQKLALVN